MLITSATYWRQYCFVRRLYVCSFVSRITEELIDFREIFGDNGPEMSVLNFRSIALDN